MNTFAESGIKIGTKLRRLRMEKGYKQEYLAEVLEISQKTYSNMENDKSSISLDTLKKIAQEYKIELIDLIKDDKVIIQNNSFNDTSTSNGIVVNHSEELIIQLKERIADKDKIIENLNKRLEVLEKRFSN
jgi:transcriptional regulator with XRE-family HTH domain